MDEQYCDKCGCEMGWCEYEENNGLCDQCLKLEEELKEKVRLEDIELNEKARELGVEGLYRLVLEHQKLLKTHQRAIESLDNGDTHKAFRILNGYE